MFIIFGLQALVLQRLSSFGARCHLGSTYAAFDGCARGQVDVIRLPGQLGVSVLRFAMVPSVEISVN